MRRGIALLALAIAASARDEVYPNGPPRPPRPEPPEPKPEPTDDRKRADHCPECGRGWPDVRGKYCTGTDEKPHTKRRINKEHRE